MKNVFFVVLVAILMIFAACSNSIDQSVQSSINSSTTNKQEDNTAFYDSFNTDNNNHENINESQSIKADDESEQEKNQNTNSIESDNSDLNVGGKEDKDPLSQYSSRQIEYARVWLQLGSNQDIDRLNVQHISAGTPLDTKYYTSVMYPEDVIQLTGDRLLDGSVTYSGNGDGTINVYNVPSRWYGGFPPPDNIDKNKIIEEMKDIIKNTKLLYVDPGDDEKIIKLIKLLRLLS
ncbi:hypothetical protein [Ammoniphilus resinae]|uniref:Lipoprotein n=1 Tax=Ammoniphilus resinae TaxID=861532 RepID=A0ABS4GPH2_9BACL|nr:hypothetical protein [Ammoniphilus resinae]MBP1932022.1 hypothetical protein [Ammoniphilus resinae]